MRRSALAGTTAIAAIQARAELAGDDDQHRGESAGRQGPQTERYSSSIEEGPDEHAEEREKKTRDSRGEEESRSNAMMPAPAAVVGAPSVTRGFSLSLGRYVVTFHERALPPTDRTVVGLL